MNASHNRSLTARSSSTDWITSALVGFAMFITVVGGVSILHPENIAWLSDGDPRTHYLGWAFYRQDDWQWPLGLNPTYGLNLSNAIIYSDSIPLLAIPLKSVSGVLSDVFQYFGIWILLCMILQAYVAIKIARKMTDDLVSLSIFSMLVVCSPPLLWRLSGHYSLMAHFTILAGLFLYLDSFSNRRLWRFPLLLALAASIHSYLLAMVLLIWVASLGDYLIRRRDIDIRIVCEFIFGVFCVVVVTWQVGYFTVSDGIASGGYGFYKMNGLALVDPDQWSYVIKDIGGGDGDYEGFNYLGLGNILAIILLLPFFRLRLYTIQKLRHYPFACITLVFLTFFSMSTNLSFGAFTWELPPVPLVSEFGSIFRSSGRMFWPVFYVIVIFGLYYLIRSYSLRIGRGLMFIILAVQLLDTSSGWSFRSKFEIPTRDSWDSPLTDEFWSRASAHYHRIEMIPPNNLPPSWGDIAYLAAKNKLSTNAVYLARLDATKLIRAQSDAAELLKVGSYRGDTLYILGDEAASRAASTLNTKDKLIRVDGLSVLAPDWNRCVECATVTQLSSVGISGGGPVVLGDPVHLSADTSRSYLSSGWSDTEDWGVWSEGKEAVLAFDSDLPKNFDLELSARAFGPNVEEEFVLWAGSKSTTFRLSFTHTSVVVQLRDIVKVRALQFTVPRPTSPAELGQSEDVRTLGIGISSFRIIPLDDH